MYRYHAEQSLRELCSSLLIKQGSKVRNMRGHILINIKHNYKMQSKLKTRDEKRPWWRSLIPGMVASIVTQPLEVLKTNMIQEPKLYTWELHERITQLGWSQYMRGSTLAMVRQGFGFAIYTSLITEFNQLLQPHHHKLITYSLSSISAKLIAMVLEAPLTLLKTRMEVIHPHQKSLLQQVSQISKSPISYLGRGLSATLYRQCIFSLTHYNLYRFFKDQICQQYWHIDATFMPAFAAATFAIFFSQPFEVIRSRVSVDLQLSVWASTQQIWKEMGMKGFFIGYTPRFLRKSFNSALAWYLLSLLYK